MKQKLIKVKVEIDGFDNWNQRFKILFSVMSRKKINKDTKDLYNTSNQLV